MKDVALVQWFLGFLNVDLEKQSAGDILKLVTELEGALRGAFYGGQIGDLRFADVIIHATKTWTGDNERVRSLLENECHRVKRLQKVLNDFVQSIRDKYESARNSVAKPLATDEFTSLAALGSLKVTLEAKATIQAISWGDEDGAVCFWKEKDLNEATCKVETSSANFEEAIKYQFLTSFNGLPLRALRKCPMCGNWFLHLSKRGREFCSNKCAARKTSRERYERLKSDPESYKRELEQSKERAHKSHLRRKKAEHGPNVKVERRPRKKREEV